MTLKTGLFASLAANLLGAVVATLLLEHEAEASRLAISAQAPGTQTTTVTRLARQLWIPKEHRDRVRDTLTSRYGSSAADEPASVMNQRFREVARAAGERRASYLIDAYINQMMNIDPRQNPLL